MPSHTIPGRPAGASPGAHPESTGYEGASELTTGAWMPFAPSRHRGPARKPVWAWTRCTDRPPRPVEAWQRRATDPPRPKDIPADALDRQARLGSGALLPGEGRRRRRGLLLGPG